MNYFTYKKELSQLENERELFDKMTNQLVRELVLKNGIKISIFIDKKTDSEKFNLVINEELKFQRKKIELLKGN
jgi:hypothetical protein